MVAESAGGIGGTFNSHTRISGVGAFFNYPAGRQQVPKRAAMAGGDETLYYGWCWRLKL